MDILTFQHSKETFMAIGKFHIRSWPWRENRWQSKFIWRISTCSINTRSVPWRKHSGEKSCDNMLREKMRDTCVTPLITRRIYSMYRYSSLRCKVDFYAKFSLLFLQWAVVPGNRIVSVIRVWLVAGFQRQSVTKWRIVRYFIPRGARTPKPQVTPMITAWPPVEWRKPPYSSAPNNKDHAWTACNREHLSGSKAKKITTFSFKN